MDPRDADRQRLNRWLELQEDVDEDDALTAVGTEPNAARSRLEQMLLSDEDLPEDDEGETIVMNGHIAHNMMNIPESVGDSEEGETVVMGSHMAQAMFDDEGGGAEEGETVMMDGASAAAMYADLDDDETDVNALESNQAAWHDPHDTQPTLNEQSSKAPELPYTDWDTPQSAASRPVPPPPLDHEPAAGNLGLIVLALAALALICGLGITAIALVLFL